MTQLRIADFKLTAKQARFVAEYLVDLNATQAAIRAGYSEAAAKQIGSRLLTNVDVRTEIRKAQQAQIDAIGIDAERVKLEMARLAFVDIRGFYHPDGRLKGMHELTAEQGAALAGVETMLRNVEAGDGRMDTVYKIKLFDKIRPLEMLAKHFGLLVERVEVDVNVNVVSDRLKAARARLAAHQPKALEGEVLK